MSHDVETVSQSVTERLRAMSQETHTLAGLREAGKPYSYPAKPLTRSGMEKALARWPISPGLVEAERRVLDSIFGEESKPDAQ